MKILSLVLVAAMAFSSQDALAKRLGGGSSVGKQSSNVTQREATPAAPAGMPGVQNSGAAAKPATAPAMNPATAAAKPKRPWGAMLGGLAAGLGLAWLASSLGFGEEFGQILLFGLLALVVMGVVGAILRARAAKAQAANPMAFGAAGAGGATPAYSGGYNPHNVGNDASARPFERSNSLFDGFNNSHSGSAAPAASAAGSIIGAGLGTAAATPAATWFIPADFDTEGFLQASKANFVQLQDAWDRSDISGLRAMMTDDMLAQIQQQLAERESHTGAKHNKTEVVTLNAQLLGIEELPNEYMASVEFSGLIREEVGAGPNPFREVWNITRAKNGQGGWLVAGVQALH